MRIINGLHQGKKIIAPDNLMVRPTTDLAKEALFNVLNNYFYFDKIKVLDLFAGTGNITYEFAARKAISVTAVEINDKCSTFIKKTCTNLGFDQVQVIRSDVKKFLELHSGTYDVVFADPPYDDNFDFLPDLILEKKLLNHNGWFVFEHSRKSQFSAHSNFYQIRKYGKVQFSIFVNF